MLLKPRYPILRANDPLTKGLVVACPFNEGVGTRVENLANILNPGILSGSGSPLWLDSPYGLTLNFNSTLSQYVDMGNGPYLATWSVAAWVYPVDYNSFPMIFTRGQPGPRNIDIDLNGFGQVRNVFSSGGYQVLTGNAVVPLNTWTFIVAIYNGATQFIYINGMLDAFSSASGAPDDAAPMQIGALQGGNFFNGRLDGILVYNRGLSAAEVIQLYLDSFAIYRPRRSWSRVAIPADPIGVPLATIKLKRSTTPAAVPGSLNPGELAINLADKILYSSDGVTVFPISFQSAAQGANTQIQFNDSGVMNATAGFIFNKTTNNATLGNNITAVLHNFSVGANVGANVHLTAATLQIGNSIANATTNSTLLSLSNATATANLSPSGLIIGSAAINTTTFGVGSNAIANSSGWAVGNSSVNVIANSTSLVIKGVRDPVEVEAHILFGGL